MGAHGRLARLCAVGGVAATSFALVKVIDNNINIQQQQKPLTSGSGREARAKVVVG